MFEFIKEIKNSVNRIDKMTSENKFMTNPFNKVVNQTFVWTEKPELFRNILK